MTRLSSAAAVVAAFAFSTSAFAQTVDEQLNALVNTWIVTEAADMDPIVQEYGISCITPLVLGLPDTAKQTLITAGGMELGIPVLETGDPATYATWFPQVQQCIEAMFVGEPIMAWVAVTEAAAGPEGQKTAAFCVMDAIKPLTTEQKQLLYAAAMAPDADFEDALDALVTAEPAMEAPLQAAIEPCV